MPTVIKPDVPLGVPDHRFTIVLPDGTPSATVHPVIADEPAVTLTSDWKPPGHELTVVTVAVQSPLGPPPASVVNVTGDDACETFPAESRATTRTIYAKIPAQMDEALALAVLDVAMELPDASSTL